MASSNTSNFGSLLARLSLVLAQVQFQAQPHALRGAEVGFRVKSDLLDGLQVAHGVQSEQGGCARCADKTKPLHRPLAKKK